MWAVLSPIPTKREVPFLLFDETKIFLKIKHDLMRPVLCYLKRHNLLIKLQPWFTFLWTTFCPCFQKGQLYYLFLLSVLPLFNKYILAYQWFSFVVRFFTSFIVSFFKDSIKKIAIYLQFVYLTNLKYLKPL